MKKTINVAKDTIAEIAIDVDILVLYLCQIKHFVNDGQEED